MQENGTLIFRVFTSIANLPVEGAAVLVRLQDAPGTLLGIRVTNSSGETDPIVISAPKAALSQSPESGVQPWTGLQAIIEHPDYERAVLTGLQIIPGIETIQTIRMVPLQRFDADNAGQIGLNFTPQPIWEGAEP